MHVQVGGTDYRLILPRDMLDAECGAAAGEEARRAWVSANLSGIMTAISAREGGGWIKAPFDSILVEEIT